MQSAGSFKTASCHNQHCTYPPQLTSQGDAGGPGSGCLMHTRCRETLRKKIDAGSNCQNGFSPHNGQTLNIKDAVCKGVWRHICMSIYEGGRETVNTTVRHSSVLYMPANGLAWHTTILQGRLLWPPHTHIPGENPGRGRHTSAAAAVSPTHYQILGSKAICINNSGKTS